ncbi:type IIG restriction enzyme/methyltransferase [Spirosoma aerophilum]
MSTVIKPRKALNKAYLKVKPNRTDIEAFKENLITLLDHINDAESEEFHKNLVSRFLHDTYYGTNHFINTKGRNDLVIHNGKDAKSSVGLILEAKKPKQSGHSEMLRIDRINTKAMQELVLYYLRERITGKNLEIKHLVATNIYEWFIFDAAVFEKAFAQNKGLVRQFTDFEEKRLAGHNTDFFYKEIAEPAITAALSELVFTHFNILEYDKPLRNADKEDDTQLIALFKLLSPEHLLKLPFTNDSNSLDKQFYSELLHIIGLTEIKEGNKKLIDRKPVGQRNNGSLIESAIKQLDSMDKISRLDRPSQFGSSNQERLYNVALELAITWINRILFLKLLEAQLISYHKGDRSYAFLNGDRIHDFDDLNTLFFSVLARRPDERDDEVQAAFAKVPYLNSSLFDPTEIEQVTIVISNLRDDRLLPILPSTVLKDAKGKKRTGDINALTYIFEFLNAYDFGSEGSENIQEDNKTLINASVLGLIFEKINGYKDGSFFTPGFITMYMCRETIRQAVLQKFNDVKGWKCSTIDELYDSIRDKKEANTIINSLKICDPAVGSGHFLVSALNEIISVKSDLHILLDRQDRTLRDYTVEVVNDELILTDDDGKLFEYHPGNKESQRIQEALFHEKQTVIENCLFGVDINHNSVKICRLRLWIELLKNAYYRLTTDSTTQTLETLPNIDINIKTGNSLISRFPLDSDMRQALKKSKWNITSYREAVQKYRNPENKAEKREMESLISGIKRDFRTEISANDPKLKKLRDRSGELNKLVNQILLFPETKAEIKLRKDLQSNLEAEINKLTADIEEIKSNKIYENAFEWRFEFPEVLTDEGDFKGFDVVIGNPPYIRIQDLRQHNENIVEWYNANYFSTGSGNYDLYIPFIELGYSILATKGDFCFIMPHKFINATYGEKIREFILKDNSIRRIVHFGALQVFEDASTYTGLFFLDKKKNNSFEFTECKNFNSLKTNTPLHFDTVLASSLTSKEWVFFGSEDDGLLTRIVSSFPSLESVTKRIFQGLKTSADKIFILEKLSESNDYFEVLCKEDGNTYELEKGILFPLMKGGDSRDYQILGTDLLILFPYKDATLLQTSELLENYPKVWAYLNIHKSFLENRESGKFKNEKWYVFGRNQALDVITQPKIFTPDIAPTPRISYDDAGEFMFTGGVSGGYGIVPNDNISPYFLLAILNSKTAFWYITKTSTQMRGGWYSFESRYIKSVPIPCTKEDNSALIQKVIELTSKRQIVPVVDTTELEAEIEKIVYNLYGLSEEEITYIENVVSEKYSQVKLS